MSEIQNFISSSTLDHLSLNFTPSMSCLPKSNFNSESVKELKKNIYLENELLDDNSFEIFFEEIKREEERQLKEKKREEINLQHKMNREKRRNLIDIKIYSKRIKVSKTRMKQNELKIKRIVELEQWERFKRMAEKKLKELSEERIKERETKKELEREIERRREKKILDDQLFELLEL